MTSADDRSGLEFRVAQWALWIVLGLILFVGMVGQAEARLDDPALCTPAERAQGLEQCLTPSPILIRATPAPSRPPGEAAANPSEGSDPVDLVPFTYARVITTHMPVYASPEDAALGLPPVRNLGAGYLWVSLGKRPTYVESNGETWVMINKGEYVRASAISVYRPSRFQGVELAEQPAVPFAWILKPVQPSKTPGGPPDPEAPKLNRYDIVNIYDTKVVNDVRWDQIGQDQWIDHRRVGQVAVSPRPEGVGPTEKWIEVNLYEQTLAAYEGDRMVYATLVSSGLPQWATPEGLTRIWIKLRVAKMSGAEGRSDYYFLEDVPWIMYFNKAVGLHGAYWHDGFGYVRSHGCVNLAPRDAEWLFNWTTPVVPEGTNSVLSTEDNPGTWVWVHR
ncbi:MAG: hypothetical protein C4310_08620 [Chloroflexota bacterium]